MQGRTENFLLRLEYPIGSLHYIITESDRLDQIYFEPAIVAYKKDKSLKDLLSTIFKFLNSIY